MKKLILAVAAFAMLAASPALAQYYSNPPPPPHGQQYDDRGYEGPRRGYDGPRSYEDHRRYEDRRHFEDRRGPRPQPRVCFTGRGSCAAPEFSRPGDRCRCFIPGFGEKRGNVR